MDNNEGFVPTQGEGQNAEAQQIQQIRQQDRQQQQTPTQQVHQQQFTPMQPENLINQSQPQQNIQNDQVPQYQEQGEINQEQEQEQENIQQTDQKQQKQNSQQAADKESYINQLEGYLNKVRIDLSQKSKQFDQLTQENKKTKQTLKKVRFQFLSSKQQISTLTQQKSELQKQTESLQKQNKQLKDQIQVYREAGDVNLFKNKITELEKLLQIQKQELKLKETMIDEKQELSSEFSQSKSKIQILSLIQKYETQNQRLLKQSGQVMMANKELENQVTSLQLQIKELKIIYIENQSSLASYKQANLLLEQKLKSTQQEYTKKLRISEQSLVELIHSQQKNPNPELLPEKRLMKNPEQKYGIRILNPAQQRDFILKQFIELEVRYQSTAQQLSTIRQRHFNIMRQIKNISITHINKKEYSELYKKYNKLKKCLEKSLLNEQSLRKELKRLNSSQTFEQQNADINISQSQKTNLESRYRSMILEEPQNAIHHVQKILEKSSQSQKQLFTLRQQLQTKQRLIKAEKQLKQKDEKLQKLQKQIQTSRNLIKLYDNELTFKNNEIAILRNTHQQNINTIHDLETNRIQKREQHNLLSQIEEKKILLQILEVKNIQSLKENNLLKSQNQVLTQLYNNLKSMYEQILNRQPQIQSQANNKSEVEKSANPIIAEIPPCLQCQTRQQKRKQMSFSETQIQTQGLAELYFKQIKYLLTILKKFPQKVDDITGKLEAEKSKIHEVKKRYDQVTETYGAKSRQLEEQKKANEQWRSKQREQIREEFQDIRELLMNQRLVTALKKAKSLIEYYEENAPQVQGEDIAEQGEQERNEKNEPIQEEIIQEEKQNV